MAIFEIKVDTCTKSEKVLLPDCFLTDVFLLMVSIHKTEGVASFFGMYFALVNFKNWF